jgi:hypothetical protein
MPLPTTPKAGTNERKPFATGLRSSGNFGNFELYPHGWKRTPGKGILEHLKTTIQDNIPIMN